MRSRSGRHPPGCHSPESGEQHRGRLDLLTEALPVDRQQRESVAGLGCRRARGFSFHSGKCNKDFP
jgi:hypothetical protein